MGLDELARDDDAKHRRLIYKLRRAGIKSDRRLANVLARCTEDRPCRNAACIHCGRDFQRVAFDLVEQEIHVPARRDLRRRMSALTLIPTAGCMAPDELSASTCRRVVADVEAALIAVGIATYALSLDISFNEHESDGTEPHWCSHVHVLIPDWLTAGQKKALKAAFPSSRLVQRPVRIEQLDRNENGRFYIFKPDRVRRVAGSDGGRPKRRVLRPQQAVALAHVEHELGYEYRLVTNGIDEEAVRGAREAFYRARDGP